MHARSIPRRRSSNKGAGSDSEAQSAGIAAALFRLLDLQAY